MYSDEQSLSLGVANALPLSPPLLRCQYVFEKKNPEKCFENVHIHLREKMLRLNFFLFQGLRLSVILGSLGTCIGSWIKLTATGRTQYPIMFTGQSIIAISQIFILGIPAQLAATWFPSSQVSSACAIGVFGNQVKISYNFWVKSYFLWRNIIESKIRGKWRNCSVRELIKFQFGNISPGLKDFSFREDL